MIVILYIIVFIIILFFQQVNKTEHFENIQNLNNIIKNISDNKKISNLNILQLNDLSFKDNKSITSLIIDKINSILPDGIIMSWYGSEIPNGWFLCDGNN